MPDGLFDLRQAGVGPDRLIAEVLAVCRQYGVEAARVEVLLERENDNA